MKTAAMQQNTYEQFADCYAQMITQSNNSIFNSNIELTIPKVLEVAGPLAGLTVLDAGCGEGIVSRFAAEKAARVVGIDVAPRFIELAQARDTTQMITYAAHDLSQPLPQYASTFDIVLSNMVMNDVPDYKGFIATISASLKPGGRFVFSMNNPYVAVLKEKVDSYFDSGTTAPYGFMARDGAAVYYYHRTMAEYIAAFQAVGLQLCRLLDLQITDEMMARFPDKNREFPWYDMYSRLPFFVVLELVKSIVPE